MTTFLQDLYKGKPNDHHILIWTLKGKRSKWFKTVKEAEDFISANPDDTYFGVGTSIKDFGPSKRCTKSKISGIPGLYVDIDIKPDGEDSKAHKGKKYPKSMKEALSLVEGQGMDPSIIINSGYGLHCYWLFDDFWSFDNNAERQQAAELEQRMNATILNRAKRNGMAIDSVFDLSRVLRPAGSNNCKRKKPAAVTVQSDSGKRYDPLDLERDLDKLPDKKIKDTHRTFSDIKIDPGLKVNPKVEIKADDLFELSAQQDQFNATWAGKRGFKSPSEYDLSLANMAVEAGWSDQKVVNLIIHHRRKTGELDPVKMTRKDYFDRTIRLAKEAAKKNEFERLTDKIVASGTIFDQKTIQDVTNHINKLLKPLKFVEIRKHINEPKVDYFIDVIAPDGTAWEIKLEGSLQTRLLFIKNLQDRTNVRPRIGVKQWDALSQAFSIVVVEVERSLRMEQIQDATVIYVEKFIANKNVKLKEVWSSGQPFKHKGEWVLNVKKFHTWFTLANNEGDYDQKSLRADLKEAGFKGINIWLVEHQADGSYLRKKKAYMKIPKSWPLP